MSTMKLSANDPRPEVPTVSERMRNPSRSLTCDRYMSSFPEMSSNR